VASHHHQRVATKRREEETEQEEKNIARESRTEQLGFGGGWFVLV
jgi:hypothetical protein